MGNRNKRNSGFILLVVFLSVAFAAGALTSPAFGQVLYGSITGTVTDATGAAVPNVNVTATDQGTGAERIVKSGSAGEYQIGNLLPGTYTVSIATTGNFGGFTQKNVALNVNQIVRVDITLQAAAVSAEVTVTAAPPMLQTDSAEVTHQISEAQISQLPITSSQGRNFQALYQLVPGVYSMGEQNSTSANPSRAMAINVNGVSNMGTTTRIDGAVNTYGWLPYLIAYVPPADSIQNVAISTNSFNAEQGLAGGAAINVTIKSGTSHLHGSAWWYNQLHNTNARAYTATPQVQPSVPKNIFNQFGFSIGGPVYIPRVMTSKSKLFFFDAFERTTRRQLITGTQTVPSTAMLGGDFSAVQSGLSATANTILYDPQPGGTGPYLALGSRPTFLSEYGCNCIPASRQFPGSAKMLSLLQPISSGLGTPTAAQLSNQLANNFFGSGTLGYNRNTNDAKITYIASDSTTLFGRYSIEPFSITDPQQLGQAGGGTFDGGQPGASSGRIQNVGLGTTHVITSHIVLDADFGYTRQVTGAQSTLDLSVGDFGLNTLGIPGTNGPGPNYAGMPQFSFTGFSAIGNPAGASPFLFRDNQFTVDANLSWNIRKHSTKYGFTWYHFDLNHFQPTGGGGINNPRGGFQFQGGMTTGPQNLSASGSPNNINAYTSLADFLLGLPNNNGGAAIAKPYQLTNPNSLRWSTYAAYAQDQWTVTPKLTLNYGVRYEFYPPPYRDHTGIYRMDPNLPQSANVVIGGVGGNPQNAGLQMGWGMFVPRLGIAYRVNESMVIRAGAGITTDADSLRFLRDSFPITQAPTYSGATPNSIALNTNGSPLPLSVGIPAPVVPDISSGFVSLPISGGTNTVPKNYHRGYIQSWNVFIEQDLGNRFVANIGYVGTHQVRQLSGYTLNSAPLPSGSTICMPNGHFNPSSPYGTGTCNFAANQAINFGVACPPGTTAANQGTCYNTGGITWNTPLWGSNYNALQAQLSRNAGRLAQFGLSYTWSRAFNYGDNGAGTGAAATTFSYPGYWKLNRALATYDRTNIIQFYGIYHLPFGGGQRYLNQGIASKIFGGFQLNGQISHVGGAPFSVNAASNTSNAPGISNLFADLIAPYHQLGGHNRTPGNTAVSSGLPWFDPTSFANPVQPTNAGCTVPSCMVSPHFGNTHRNQFRGPGVDTINASVVRDFHVWRESAFQVRLEAFNLLNHPQFNPSGNNNPQVNNTVGGGTFGYITTFGSTRSLQFSGRVSF